MTTPTSSTGEARTGKLLIMGVVAFLTVAAGIGAGGPLASLTLAVWRRVMDVNLDGAFLTLATALRVAYSP